MSNGLKVLFPRPDAALNIAIAGDDQLASELAQLAAGRTVEGRPITTRRLNEPDALAGSHVLLIARAEQHRFIQFVKAAQGRPILIVSETEGALSQGSMINFVISGGRVKFEISLENAEKMTLRLSSRLLAVAQSVKTGLP